MHRTLKDAVQEVVHESKITPRELADDLGIAYSYLTNAANPNLEDFHFQLRHLIPITRRTNNFAILDYIENALGRVAIHVPKDTMEASQVHTELFRTIEAFGALAKNAASALEDNRITMRESKELEKTTWTMVKQAIVFLQTAQEAVK